MRTKVRFRYSDDKFFFSKRRFNAGDYGEIDGYVGDSNNQYAVVLINRMLIGIPIYDLEILDDNTIIPIPDSNKFPTNEEINEMAGKYDLGPNYNMEPGFYAAISWIKEWMTKRNLL